nr:hypothetical protein GCM10020092_056710 [Actinoplanes digitatis]
MTVPAEIAASKQISLTTYRKDGTPVATPVWHVADGKTITTVSAADAWKVKRLRRNPPRSKLLPATSAAKSRPTPTRSRAPPPSSHPPKPKPHAGSWKAATSPPASEAGSPGCFASNGRPASASSSPSEPTTRKSAANEWDTDTRWRIH